MLRRSILIGINRTGQLIERGAYYLNALGEELIANLAQPEDWSELTTHAYNRNRNYLDSSYNEQLYDWEKKAIARFFPEAPAKIFIGAAGAGREMCCLASQGYRVAGIEPAHKLAARCQTRVEHLHESRFLGLQEASYEELAKGIVKIESHAPFDAAILGFGSLGHVASEGDRVALLSKMQTLTNGPLLLSWSPTKASKSKAKIRKTLKRVGIPVRPQSEQFSPAEGFYHYFDHQDIFALAHQCAYQVAHFDDTQSFPHAVFVAK